MKKRNIIIFIGLIGFLWNCSGGTKQIKESFVLQFTSDSLLNLIQPQKIDWIWVKKDSSIIVKANHFRFVDSIFSYEKEIHFVERKGSFFERQHIYSLSNLAYTPNTTGTSTVPIVDSLTYLCLCNQVKDTSFAHIYNKHVNYISGVFDFYYHIKQINPDLFVSYMGNIHDRQYGRMFFYDAKYHIIKIIEMYRNKFFEYINEKDIGNSKHQKSFYFLYVRDLKQEQNKYLENFKQDMWEKQ